MTMQEAICKALEARGEKRIDDRTSKYIQYTRTWKGLRGESGELRLAPNPGTFWFVSKSGSLRIGRKASDSALVLRPVRDALVREGKAEKSA